MTRIKPVTVVGCSIQAGETHTMEGGRIYACLLCRGIGFFNMQGTVVKDQYWITASTARKEHEHDPRVIFGASFWHVCMKDTRHPINKRVNQKLGGRRGKLRKVKPLV